MKFRLVDRITEWEAQKSISGVKTVSFEEYNLRKDWGGPAALPESLVMESLLQLGNWLILLTSQFKKMGILVRFEEVKFFSPVGPGDTLNIQVHIRRYRDDGVLFDGNGRVEDRLAVRGTGVLAVPVNVSDYADPDDLRVLSQELIRTGR